MRAGIVSSAAVAKYGRLDAGFYLGDVEEKAEAVRRAEANLVRAKARLRAARRELAEEKRRRAELARVGEVKFLR